MIRHYYIWLIAMFLVVCYTMVEQLAQVIFIKLYIHISAAFACKDNTFFNIRKFCELFLIKHGKSLVVCFGIIVDGKMSHPCHTVLVTVCGYSSEA